MNKKTFALDTNVLLHDPDCIKKFGNNNILIPVPVLEELDNFKKSSNELGYAARAINRYLDEIQERAKERGEQLHTGIYLENGCWLKVLINVPEDLTLHPALDHEKVDNYIVEMVYDYQMMHEYEDVVMISKDCNMRVKAASFGLECQDYQNSKVEVKDIYSKTKVVEVPDEDYCKLMAPDNEQGYDDFLDLRENDFAMVSGETTDKPVPVWKKFNRLWIVDEKQGVFGKLKAKNIEQEHALTILFESDIKCCALLGPAGSGKSLLAVAAGLQMAVNDNQFKKIVVTRPTIAMGKEIGFLPGSAREKMDSWMGPIYDSFEFLFKGADSRMTEGKALKEMEDMGMVRIEPLSFIRGRTFHDTFFIVDEAQNLTPLEMKTIITRIGKNSKIVFTGDPYQIDSPYLDVNSNGLSYLVDKFKREEIFGYTYLWRGERSKLAELGAKKL